MSIISVNNLTFSYDGSYDYIFENVSFQIDTDWKLGFIGRNGCGKTTFLNLLRGKYEYRGTISSSVEVDYFPFEVEDKDQSTLDVVYSIAGNLELWRLKKELSKLELDEDVLYQPYCLLSNGEQTKVLLAALFQRDNNFLLIDEPTNHLDMKARQVVGNYLKNKKGFILVSHDREFLNNCVDHILAINKTTIEVQKGNFSTWWSNKENRDRFEQAQNAKLKNEIKELTAAARRTANWSAKIEKGKIGNGVYDRGYVGHKAAKMMKRSKSLEARRQKAIAVKETLLKDLEIAESLTVSPLTYHKRRLAEVRDLSIFYGEKEICRDINLEIERGDRIALIGKNGCGKTSILKLLLGQDLTYRGELNIGNKLIISYVPQDTSFLKGNLRDFALAGGIDESLFKTILRKLDFPRVQFEKDMQDFSAGQKKKVLLAQSLCRQAHLYIWDEPLNFIDVLSRMQIEDVIVSCQPTMLFVEHDISFVHTVATKKLYL